MNMDIICCIAASQSSPAAAERPAPDMRVAKSLARCGCATAVAAIGPAGARQPVLCDGQLARWQSGEQ